MNVFLTILGIVLFFGGLWGVAGNKKFFLPVLVSLAGGLIFILNVTEVL